MPGRVQSNVGPPRKRAVQPSQALGPGAMDPDPPRNCSPNPSRLTSKSVCFPRPTVSRPSQPATGLRAMDRGPGREPGESVPTTKGSPADSGKDRQPSFGQTFRNRIISGLIFALPIAITFSIVYWLLMML